MMRIGQFANKTNLSVKVARWLYDNVFHEIKTSQHRYFTEENVQYVKQRQILTNLVQLEETSDKYYIDNQGNIYSYKRGFLELRKQRIVQGYYYITLWNGVKHISYRTHRLVAKYFVPNNCGYNCINHIDGNKVKNPHLQRWGLV